MRISLTKAALETEGGKALRDYLWWIAHDGYVSDEEVHHMKEWLGQCTHITDVPGIHYLRELVSGILSDGVIDEGERSELHRTILRVLPKDYREAARDQKRAVDAAKKGKEAAEKQRLAYLATDKQIAYLRSLGGQVLEGMSKSQASEEISRLTENRATVRQQMVLRFWDRLDLVNARVDGVSDWMDHFYGEDPRRLIAWEVWKEGVGDYGSRDPKLVEKVPLGIGKKILKEEVGHISKRQAAQWLQTGVPPTKQVSPGMRLVWWVLGIVILVSMYRSCTG